MSEDNKKVLLFIKAPSHNLKPLEAFLSKRNFVVHSESEIKDALLKALELQPDFVFVAWDHPNPKINQLPSLIAQSIMAPVVAYIMSNTKEATRKLNICPINSKLYPPISGPAIERLVLKSGKAAVAEEQRITQVKSKAKSQEELMQVRADLLAHLENENSNTTSEIAAAQTLEQQELNNQILRNKSIIERNDILQRSAKVSLSDEVVDELKKTFEEKVKVPLENLLENMASIESLDENPNSNGNIIIQKGFENPQGLGTVVQKGLGEGTTLGTTIQKNISQPEGIGTIIQKNTNSDDQLGMTIQKNLSNSHELGSLTEEVSDTEIPALIEKDPQARAAYLELTQKEKLSKPSYKPSPDKVLRAYCMSVYSDNWCGYLVISTDADLDFSTIDLVFTDWIKLQFNNLQEIDEYDFFEFKLVEQGFIDGLAPKADYFEQVTVGPYNLNVLFFPIDPTKMTLELNDEKNLIQVNTEEIPSDVELSFSLHLHLPENKKYLVYTQVNKSLTLEQKKRLIANRVHILFTPLDFEKEYKKFMAEKNVKEIYTNMKKKLQ